MEDHDDRFKLICEIPYIYKIQDKNVDSQNKSNNIAQPPTFSMPEPSRFNLLFCH